MKRENRYKLPNPMIKKTVHHQIFNGFAIILNLILSLNLSIFIKNRANTLGKVAVLLYFY